MHKLLIPLLAAFALPTAVNASGFWLLTTTVKKPAALKNMSKNLNLGLSQ